MLSHLGRPVKLFPYQIKDTVGDLGRKSSDPGVGKIWIVVLQSV
jgi:hypothetical protein